MRRLVAATFASKEIALPVRAMHRPLYSLENVTATKAQALERLSFSNPSRKCPEC